MNGDIVDKEAFPVTHEEVYAVQEFKDNVAQFVAGGMKIEAFFVSPAGDFLLFRL